jgi:2-polyprenyl-3-methyl-5-hydroxy-6-metoxy-1,4-benzoquinol methylase
MWAKRAQRVSAIVRSGRALDVGTGFGDFLEHLRAAGQWTVEGTEVSDEAAAHAEETHAFRVHRGQVEDCGLPPGQFDLVTMWHVLEHVPVPALTLDHVIGLLRPGGLLVIAVPNEGIVPRLALLYAKDVMKYPIVKLLGRPYRRGVDAYFGPAKVGHEIHLSFFSPKRLSNALERRGMNVLQVGVDVLSATPTVMTDVRFRLAQYVNDFSGLNFTRACFIVAQR